MSLDAFYFDGHTSQRHAAFLAVQEGRLLFRGPEGEQTFALKELQISEPQGTAPRTMRFPDGGTCEIPQGAALTALLDDLGYRESLTVRMQKRWGWSFFALILVTLTMLSGYRWGLPLFAEATAPMVPTSSLVRLSNGSLRQMEKAGYLYPSQLPYAQRQKLSSAFFLMAGHDPELAHYGENLTLLFYRGPKIGPNAFALPGGQIVLLDELVELIGDDEKTLAILAHELGHVSHRHGTRQLIQSSVVSAFAAAYFGDVSSIATILTTMVLESSYSRDMEREADDYAAQLLIQHEKSPILLAEALEHLENSFRKRSHRDDDDDVSSGWLDSHPGTQERIARLKTAQARPRTGTRNQGSGVRKN